MFDGLERIAACPKCYKLPVPGLRPREKAGIKALS